MASVFTLVLVLRQSSENRSNVKSLICSLYLSLVLVCFLSIRKKFALPEDIEYFNIQLQMNYDLYDEYKEVERIIGKYLSFL